MILKAMTSYPKAVKEAKRSFFSSLILANHSNPRILFKTIDSVTTPSPCHFIDASQETCEKFFKFFSDKVMEIRQQHLHEAHRQKSRSAVRFRSKFQTAH